MTEAQLDDLDILDLLDALSVSLSMPASQGREQQVATVRVRLDATTDALSQLIQAFGTDGASGTDCLTLSAVRETLRSKIGDRLAAVAAGNDATAVQTLASMAAVCKDERTAINLLSRKPDVRKPMADSSEPPLDAWTITLRRCIIDDGRIRTEYTRPDRPGVDAKGIGAYGLSTALAFLRFSGIRYLIFDNAGGFTIEQRSWLANSARKVFLDCGSRANLVVNATVCVPSLQVTMYTHMSFLPSGTCQISFESFPIPVVPATAVALEDAKAALVARYGLKRITEQDGGAWTLVHLDQLASALAKVPAADQVVLRGCTFVRKKAAPTDTEETEEAGSYRFADRTISLLDAAFCADDYGFVGIAGAIGPYSHWTILHEVGHAVEKFRWEKDYHQWDTTKIKDDIARLEAEKQALQQAQAKTGAPQGADMDRTPRTRINELELQIIDLQISVVKCGNAQIEMVEALKRNKSSSASLLAFVKLVGEKKIAPCTGYAHRCWNDKHGEFFAEAYSLFLNEPRVLAFISKELHDWFATGEHRRSW